MRLSLTFVIVVGFVDAIALTFVMTASVHFMVLPDQPGDVLTLYPPPSLYSRSTQREVDGSYVIRSSPVKLPLIHDAFCVVVFVMSQYPSALMFAVDVVMYELGRRELFTLQDHRPVRNIILEKSGFGLMGMGVLSTCGKAAVNDRAAKAKAHRGMRNNDISPTAFYGHAQVVPNIYGS